MELNTHFDLSGTHTDGDHNDAEATLEALRVAIAAGDQSESDVYATSASLPVTTQPAPTDNEGSGLSAAQQQSLEKAMLSLTQLSQTNQTILDNMNLPGMLQGLAGSLKLLVESNRRQAEVVKNLISQVGSNGIPDSQIDPALSLGYVPKSDYDALKARYDALVSSSGVKRSRIARQSTVNDEDLERLRDGSTPLNEERSGRKKRSMKLEHLVHRMANRRLGVEYAVSQFESLGGKDLPDPASIPPPVAESANGVQEFRPQFGQDVTAESVRPFIDQVVLDCSEAWHGGVGEGEEGVDERKIQDSVVVYWTRLCKRWEEQQTRQRGEIHKDELTRRKQNQYRRQQSLVARRIAAFDQSPLNMCKLRALYRTLLTIDFAAATNERPDRSRAYTEHEWVAYQKFAGHQSDTHEVVDIFWLSSNVRTLLAILDISSLDQNARAKRKGRPKAPSPTFHLPESLWDRSSLPTLRPKDANGLPVPGGQGIVLFKFHVDQAVQDAHPAWAQGLYDNPPVPAEDAHLASLGDVMNTSMYAYIKPRVHKARQDAQISELSPEEVVEWYNRPEPQHIEAVIMDDYDLPADTFSAAASLNFDQFLAPSGTPTLGLPGDPLAGLPSLDAGAAGPSPGSSVRARKQAKRMMSEVPGGAATPVAKRVRRDDIEGEVDKEVEGDKGFLDTL
ncbi:hypothetical protein BCR39DRAFT_546724 [Naematelia encephala]|uniref:Uncharacterized protein n=1 Tax=Naematelia encephala TaxID=71784 RepID=A0A1Y2APF3_9TREE|nr:hypothetical protein BCR39DRAFT_546724 [Naematelia encephala]